MPAKKRNATRKKLELLEKQNVEMEDKANSCMVDNQLNDEESVTAVVVCTPSDLHDLVGKDSTETIATDDYAGGPLKTFKKRDELCQLTTAHEVELVSWFQENRCLYDKSLREYRETEKKNKIYEDKAHELGLTGELTLFFLL